MERMTGWEAVSKVSRGENGERVNRANLLSDFHLLGESEYGLGTLSRKKCCSFGKINVCVANLAGYYVCVNKSEVSQDAD